MKRKRGFFVGLATSGAIVLGLLVVRAVFASGYSLAAEFLSNRLTYIYVFVATAVVFMVLGYVLGRQADELRRLSMTDALTGLSNRYAFHLRLRDEWRRSQRYRAPLALLLIDVDGLKQVNDEQGHEAGDRVLRDVAGAIRHTLRGTDIGARWGGDEFAIIAPNTGSTAARRLGQRLLAHTHERTRSDTTPITVSAGLAIFDPAEGPSPSLTDADASGRPGALRSQSERSKPNRSRLGVVLAALSQRVVEAALRASRGCVT